VNRPGATELAAALTGVQVGSALVVSRALVETIDPVPLAFLRYAIGTLILVPAALAARSSLHVQRRDLIPIALCGIVQFGLLIVLLNASLRMLPSAPAALIFATMPLIALIIGIVVGQERWNRRRGAAILAAIVGLALALGPDARGLGGDRLGGELLAVAAATCGAASSVAVRPYVRRYGALPVSGVAMLASVAFLGCWAALTGELGAVDVRGRDLAGVVFLGVASGVGYLLWLWAIARSTASHVAVFLSLSPVTALVLGWLALGESLTTTMIAGLLLTLGALWLSATVNPGEPLARQPGRRRPSPPRRR
jgi:drug/metabolite transporter (DMT)-like permease